MQKETLHLTLAFIGDVSTDRLPDLLAVASEVGEAMRVLAPALPDGGPMILDHLGCWEHPRILWAGSKQYPSTPGILAELLAGKLRARGFAFPVKPFAPHVTLVRKFKNVPGASELDALKFDAPPWPCRSFVLVRSRLSHLGPAYERLGSWPLERSSS